MNAANIRHLKKELARNKAKSATLGALCLVAVYYWSPLISKSISGKKRGETQTAVNTNPDQPVEVLALANITDAELSGEDASSSGSQTKLDWKRISHATDSDVHMRSVPLDPNVRNPFAPLAIEPEALPDDDIPETTPIETATETVIDAGNVSEIKTVIDESEPEETPDFTVTSVVLGSRRSVATVNGVSYQLGGIVRTNDADIEYQIISIHADGIVVSRDGKKHRIRLTKPWNASGAGRGSFNFP
jgi:hypothetical protein